MHRRVSVIVPVLNEEDSIEACLQAVRLQAPEELLVVDGGSRDQTVQRASAYARVVTSAPGRATQMNTGAAEADGDVLLFLHADTRLPPDGLQRIRQCTQVGGRFRLRFDSAHPLLAWYAWFTRFSCFSYGDQGFFVDRPVFQALGGFSTQACLEDVEWWGRFRRHHRPVILPEVVVTSARRFEQHGVIRQQLRNLFLLTCAQLGIEVRYPGRT